MRRLVALLVVVVAGSCSPKKTPADALADVDGFCNEWGKRACNATVVGQCSAANTDACVASQAAFCKTLVPDGKYSETGAPACLDGVEAAYKTGTSLTAAQAATVLRLAAPCDKVVSGSVGEGGSCTEDSDCNRDDGLACAKKQSATGKCEKPNEVGGGEDCSAAETVCADGFYCDGSNCLAAKKTGQQCTPAIPCGAASRCVTAGQEPSDAGGAADAGSSSGTCVARAGIGTTCTTDDECTSGVCSGVCSATLVLAPQEAICKTLR